MTNPILLHAKDVMKAKGISPAELARITGISPATISQLFSGKYPGNNEEMLRKIAAATNYRTNEWKLLSTTNLRTIENLFEDARLGSRMLALHGETGMGKTAALTWLCSKTPNSYYILANVLMKQKDFVKAIQKAIGSDMEGTIVQRMEDVIEKLLQKQNPVLVIDDIGKLKEHSKCFYLLQLLFDRTEGRLGLVLAGTKAFPVFIQRQAGKDNMGFRELKRRVTYWQPLKDRVERKFITTMAELNAITQPSAIDYMAKVCNNYGDVKELITNYKRYIEIHGAVAADEQQQVISSLTFGSLSV
jgi:transcriptional regulator with XRE-family HTH domain